jgi:hypothetical protein
LAKLEERSSGLRAGKNSHAERSFLSRWQASMSSRVDCETKPNDRQMSLEDTLCCLKNKDSGMKNALVYSEILTAHRMPYGVGR